MSMIFFFLICGLLNFFISGDQQFSNLAYSFLQGKLYFTQTKVAVYDTALFEGKFYWPLQPFPAIILIPFVYIFSLFGKFFLQGYLQFFLVAGVFYLIYRICRKIKYSSNDSLFLAFAFCFSSVFLGVALWPWSWYYSQVVATFLLFLGLYEFLSKKRHWVLGVISGLLFLTRTPASLIIVLFVADIYFNTHTTFRSRLLNLTKIISPFILAIFLAFLYNQLRFRNIFELGYNFQLIKGSALKAREYGIFNLIHLPGNLYYFLLSSPTPVFKDGLSHVLTYPYIKANPWGVSIFFTSPYFLYLFLLKYKNRLLKLMWVTALIIALPILLYYGVGYRQFGYRYSLDFLPLLFLILLIGYRRKYRILSKAFKIVILVVAHTNLYLFITFLSDFI